MSRIKLITFDLDNTLLNSKKEISPETLRTLERAANEGIELVPATGRFWLAVPECVKNLKFLHYAITLNGASILDVKESKTLAKFEMPLERAITLARVLDDLPVIYDCNIDGISYMKREYYERVEEFSLGAWQLKMLKDLRTPVNDIYELIRAKNRDVQKMQLFTRDSVLREKLLQSMPVLFPENIVSTSVPNNIEINDKLANKGHALKFLAEYINIPLSASMSFGDGLNDIYMIEAAGIGVAMRDSFPEVLSAADYVTGSCNEDGVAEGIKKFCF